jgi:hypothetical protein
MMGLLEFLRRPAPLPPTRHQLGVTARATAYLIEHGVIDAMTVQKMGTTDARKMFSEMRRKGLLYEADNPRGHIDVPNRSGTGKYRVHYWTGKRLNDRRKRVRGGR